MLAENWGSMTESWSTCNSRCKGKCKHNSGQLFVALLGMAPIAHAVTGSMQVTEGRYCLHELYAVRWYKTKVAVQPKKRNQLLALVSPAVPRHQPEGLYHSCSQLLHSATHHSGFHKARTKASLLHPPAQRHCPVPCAHNVSETSISLAAGNRASQW